jgi:hypothetical protein
MATATAGNGISLTTSPLIVFDATSGGNGGPCTCIAISNRSSSSGNVLFNVLGIHASGDFGGIAPGVGPIYVRVGSDALSQLTLKSDSTAVCDWWLASRI